MRGNSAALLRVLNSNCLAAGVLPAPANISQLPKVRREDENEKFYARREKFISHVTLRINSGKRACGEKGEGGGGEKRFSKLLDARETPPPTHSFFIQYFYITNGDTSPGKTLRLTSTVFRIFFSLSLFYTFFIAPVLCKSRDWHDATRFNSARHFRAKYKCFYARTKKLGSYSSFYRVVVFIFI